MLTLIDDFSQKVRVFILKHKNEVFVKFNQLNALIEK